MLPVRVPQLLQYPFVTRKVRESYSYPTPNHPRQRCYFTVLYHLFFCHPWNSLLPRSLHLLPGKSQNKFTSTGKSMGWTPSSWSSNTLKKLYIVYSETDQDEHPRIIRYHSIIFSTWWTSAKSFSTHCHCHGNFRQPWHGLLQWCGQYSPAASRCSDLTGRADDRDGVRSCRADWWLSRAWQKFDEHARECFFLNRCFCCREWLRIGKQKDKENQDGVLVLKSLDACWYNDEHF